MAESVDLTLEIAHRQGGYPSVCSALDTDDRLEHWLSHIGAQVGIVFTGDEAMRRALQTSKAPGDSHLLPSWALEEAQSTAKAEFKADQRIRAQAGRSGGAAVPGEQVAGARRRRGPGRSGSRGAAAGGRGGGRGGTAPAGRTPAA